MHKYILKRIGLMLINFMIIMTISFIIIRLMPDDRQAGFGSDNQIYEILDQRYGYDKPIYEQYFIYLKGIITSFDWGISTKIHQAVPCTEIIFNKLPATILVNSYAFLISIPLGLLFGMIAALKKNKLTDHLITIGVMLFISVPSYVYAFVLQYFPGFKWGIFPLAMAQGTDYFTWEMTKSIILPVLALSFGSIAALTRYTRAELTEVLTSDFMLLARTKGLTKTQSTIHHAFRNSLVPIIPIIIGDFVSVLAGSLIIERIFLIPGIGSLYINSIMGLDYSLSLAIIMFYVMIGLVAVLITDIGYGIVDPRIRMGGKKNAQ